jgi:glycosyltransferase involved in cell wall biosynthesis
VTRVLLCSSYFWPDLTGIALYASGWADHLLARGDDVTVITGFPHYPSWERGQGESRFAARDDRHGIRVLRRWHHVPHVQSASTRIAYEASFLSGLTAIKTSSRPDVVIGISPCLASGAVALAAGRLHRAPVGLVFQDVLSSAATQSGIRGGARLGSVIARLELGVARQATRVGLTAEGFRPVFTAGGVAPGKIVALRNWLERSPPDQPAQQARASLGWGASEFVCLHAGNMGRKQNLETLIAAAAQLREHDIRIVMAGDGNDRARLVRLAQACDNVSFLGLRAPGAYESMLEAADVLIVNQRATVTDMALPSKLTAYFAAGRPVIAAVAQDSETAVEVRRSQAGLVVTPEDPAALAAALLKLRADAGLRSRLGELGRSYASEHLTSSAVLATWAAFVDETLHAKPR